jgi:hypothetical protein
MTTTLCATPYNIDACFFYFDGIDEYETKSKCHLDRYGNIIEEYEIQLIDSNYTDLFLACNINQAILSTWFDEIELLQDHEKISLYYLLKQGYDLTKALEMIEEPMITEGSLRDVSGELFDEIYLYSIPENIRYYIDYEKFARDCELNSELVEFEYNNKTYTCTNANGM